MRCDNHGIEREQRRLGRGFFREDVERRSGDLARANGVGQRGLVDDATSCDVDDAQRGLGFREALGVDEADGLRGFCDVNRDEVALRHERVEVDELDRHLAGALGRHKRVVSDESHAERQRALRDELADPSEADDAERLLGELDAFPLGALPAARLEGGVGLGHVAGLRQDQRHRVLGRRDHVRLRRVDDHDPVAGSCFDIDVVEADAGSADHDHAHAGRQHIRGDIGGRTDDQGVCAAHRIEQLLGGKPLAHVDLVAGRPEAFETRVGDLLGYQDAGHSTSLADARREDTPSRANW